MAYLQKKKKMGKVNILFSISSEHTAFPMGATLRRTTVQILERATRLRNAPTIQGHRFVSVKVLESDKKNQGIIFLDLRIFSLIPSLFVFHSRLWYESNEKKLNSTVKLVLKSVVRRSTSFGNILSCKVSLNINSTLCSSFFFLSYL